MQLNASFYFSRFVEWIPLPEGFFSHGYVHLGEFEGVLFRVHCNAFWSNLFPLGHCGSLLSSVLISNFSHEASVGGSELKTWKVCVVQFVERSWTSHLGERRNRMCVGSSGGYDCGWWVAGLIVLVKWIRNWLDPFRLTCCGRFLAGPIYTHLALRG